ncbi:MAG TPA: Sua5/YciO/YrdC/YwlC family protein [Candidatus Portnoybacteria bacterium]|nr:Sua5/YciO/YrdC/YwlC family protein [Candidatus Portnoybacteria bacterium]
MQKVRDIEMASQVAYLSPRIEKILKAIWPGAVTVVLNKKEILSDILTANQKTIGLRIPDHQISQSLANELDFPLTATSANLSGQPASGQIKEVIEQFKGSLAQPDLVLDAGDLSPSQPSTVIDLKDSQLRILRVGPVTKEELLKMLEIK